MKIKPPLLYHASQNTNITTLEPRALTVRNVDEGPVVFATPDKKYVTTFLVPTDDNWTNMGITVAYIIM